MIERMASEKTAVCIGHSGENEAVRVAFALDEMQTLFPGGTAALLVRRRGDRAAYPVPVEVKDGRAYWTVRSPETARPGYGQCELQWYAGKALVKSARFDFVVEAALEAGAQPPEEPAKAWFRQMSQQLEGLEKWAGDPEELTTKEKSSLVAAINEAARSGSGMKYEIGDGLKLDEETSTLSVKTAQRVEEKNTLPVSAAAVHTAIQTALGTVEAQLAEI